MDSAHRTSRVRRCVDTTARGGDREPGHGAAARAVVAGGEWTCHADRRRGRGRHAVGVERGTANHRSGGGAHSHGRARTRRRQYRACRRYGAATCGTAAGQCAGTARGAVAAAYQPRGARVTCTRAPTACRVAELLRPRSVSVHGCTAAGRCAALECDSRASRASRLVRRGYGRVARAHDPETRGGRRGHAVRGGADADGGGPRRYALESPGTVGGLCSRSGIGAVSRALDRKPRHHYRRGPRFGHESTRHRDRHGSDRR